MSSPYLMFDFLFNNLSFLLGFYIANIRIWGDNAWFAGNLENLSRSRLFSIQHSISSKVISFIGCIKKLSSILLRYIFFSFKVIELHDCALEKYFSWSLYWVSWCCYSYTLIDSMLLWEALSFNIGLLWCIGTNWCVKI